MTQARSPRTPRRATPAIGSGTDRRLAAHRAPSAPRPDRALRAPLYDPRFDHDACGVGFVAESQAGPSRRILPLALEALSRLTHRGAIAADAKTGDGAGITLPLAGLRDRILDEVGLHDAEALGPEIAVGMLFLPAAGRARRIARRAIEDTLRAEGLRPLGWRSVPVDPSVLGPTALASVPAIEQLVVGPGTRARRSLTFEARLLLARRAIEAAARQDPLLEDLYVVSLSSRTIVYKGLFVGAELGTFYEDLADPTLEFASALFHQRYSTNTHPSWRLAQPFRFLAHNGEINTVRGNRAAMEGRAADLGGGVLGRRLAAQVRAGAPMLDPRGSDSTSLDEAVEYLVASGWPIAAALMTLMPEAPGLRTEPVDGLEAWQDATATRVEPWDGPAGLVFSDGVRVGARLDRNGLRPMAYEFHADGLVVAASEAGTIDRPASGIVRRARLGPGNVLVVDTAARCVLEDAAAKAEAVALGPVTVTRAATSAPTAVAAAAAAAATAAIDPAPTDQRQRLLVGLDAEQLRVVVKAMATTAKEPIWSMGDDTPMPVLARRARPVAAYLRQAFAQVTNPPIDPERERVVVALDMVVGRRAALLDPPDAPGGAAELTHLPGPVLEADAWASLLARLEASGEVVAIDASSPAARRGAGLARRLDEIEREVVAAAKRGALAIVISDRALGADRLPVPTLLATGIAHGVLVRAGLRDRTDIVVETTDALDVHAIAMLIASGATAVHPRLALELAAEVAGTRGNEDLTAEAATANFITAVENGLRKVLARMGISTLSSYRGSGLFEIVGLDAALAERVFPTAPCWSGAADAHRLGREIVARHDLAYAPPAPPALADPGFVRFRADGELHAFSPAVARATQALAQSHPLGVGPGTELAQPYADAAIDGQLATYRAVVDRAAPAMVRDLLEPRRSGAAAALPLHRVEDARSIASRFVSSAMSLGSLSPEAHATLAQGMRLLGGSANTGEGGEDPAMLVPGADGLRRDASIKQVASGRFGVTADYLALAEQLEIKMAQGSKPGEGGQLPGAKVSELIATLRRVQPGQTVISPPPHHDIYSIEDLAQLITDLRAINPTARIGVKLVATTGVGTIAAGVAKAHADYVLISGHSGGTGASPLSSIKHAGLALGARPRRGTPGPRPPRPARPDRDPRRRRLPDRARRRDRGDARRRGVRLRHGGAARDGLRHGAPVPPRHVPHRHRDPARGPPGEVHRHPRTGRRVLPGDRRGRPARARGRGLPIGRRGGRSRGPARRAPRLATRPRPDPRWPGLGAARRAPRDTAQAGRPPRRGAHRLRARRAAHSRSGHGHGRRPRFIARLGGHDRRAHARRGADRGARPAAGVRAGIGRGARRRCLHA